jgi:hypothetical protein
MPRLPRRVAVVLALAVALSAGTAAADDARALMNGFGGGFDLGLGVGAPLGLLSVEGRLDLTRWLFLTGGAGVAPQVQLGATVHLRLPPAPGRSFAWTAGYGLSRGRHVWKPWKFCQFEECDVPIKRGTIFWHNVELGLDIPRRSSSGQVILWGLFAGLAIMGNPQDLQCQNALCDPVANHADGTGPYPYLGVTLGYWIH